MKQIISVCALCVAFGLGVLAGLAGREWLVGAEDGEAETFIVKDWYEQNQPVKIDPQEWGRVTDIGPMKMWTPTEDWGFCSGDLSRPVMVFECQGGKSVGLYLGAHGTVYWQEVRR